MDDVYCRGENKSFPGEDFEFLQGWGLCHTKNLPEGQPPHTTGGSSIPPPGAGPGRGGAGGGGGLFDLPIPYAEPPSP